MSFCEQFERVGAVLLRHRGADRIVLSPHDLDVYMAYVLTNKVHSHGVELVPDSGLEDQEMGVRASGKLKLYDDEAQCKEIGQMWALQPVMVRSYDDDEQRVDSGWGVVVGYMPDTATWTEAVAVSGPSFAIQDGDMYVAEIENAELHQIVWGDKLPLEERKAAVRRVMVGADWWCLGPSAAAVTNTDSSRFPHVCPRCGKPAYLGFNSIECSVASCR